MIAQKITNKQQEQLLKVAPSQDEDMYYRPCCVKLNNGEILNNVYVVEQESYIKTWGVMPDADSAKKHILIENVVEINESPNRLAPKFANELYNAGESGMGYCLFKVIFENGQKIDIASGNAIDFIPLPEGQTRENVIKVLPHQGSRTNYIKSLEFYWCLYKK